MESMDMPTYVTSFGKPDTFIVLFFSSTSRPGIGISGRSLNGDSDVVPGAQ